MKRDFQYMEQALNYAYKNAVGDQGQVGALLVRDGAVLSQGASNDIDGLHAEQSVLEDIDAVGATLYVTIQPSLYRTDESISSDTQMIIDAGISRVVVGSINKKYSLQESKDFFAQHDIEFVLIGDQSLSARCLEYFVFTGADQTPKVMSMVVLALFSAGIVGSLV